MTSPAPEMAWVIVFWRCQSVGIPPIAEYWHIGETAIRFGAVRDPNATVVKSADIQNAPFGRRSACAAATADVELCLIKLIGHVVSSRHETKNPCAVIGLYFR